MSAKISIIVPVYKVEGYLKRCVDSILNQTFTDFECILVDDGSPDNCGAICDEYAINDSRIKVIHKQNGGLSDARNAGLDIATGDFIAFIDSDDYVSPMYLDKVIKCFETTNSDLVIFNYQKNFASKKSNKSTFSEQQILLNSKTEYIDFCCKHLMGYKSGWEAWNRIYKSEIIKKNNLRFFDNKQIYAEDLYFNLCYISKINKINIIEDVLYYYEIRDDSITGSNRETKIAEFVKLNKEVYDYFKNNNSKFLLKNYYLIFHSVMLNRLSHYDDYTAFINMLDVREKAFFAKMAITILLNSKKFSQYHGVNRNYIVFFYTNCLAFLYNNIIFKFARLYLRCVSKIKKIIKYLPDKLWRKNIYLIGTEDFGNLGDHIISITEMKFLKDKFPKYRIIEIPASKYYSFKNQLKLMIKKKDPIYLTGGGNMGDLYMFSEHIREDIICTYPNNSIYIFPQTIYFDDENNIKSSSLKYKNARKLTIALREKFSLELSKKIYPNANNILVPDIVFYNMLNEDTERITIYKCLRNDKEKTLSDSDIIYINNILEQLCDPVETFDMQLNFNVSVADRESYVCDIIKKFQSAKLIITDRLHGMILSAITGTPCIAIGSKSHKLKGSYEFINHLDYIEFIESIDEFECALNKVLSVTNKQYSNKTFLGYYELLNFLEVKDES